MKSEMIAISTYCAVHNIDKDFIQSLETEGLITISMYNEEPSIDEEQLHQLEVYTQWYSLGINAAGMDALSHLIQKVRNLQLEINHLRARLRTYEDSEDGTEF